MSTSFSANQYDDAFTSKKLRNWEIPTLYRERPRTMYGSPRTITANDRGHLRPEFRRSNTEPWGSFVGTWDLPKRLPGNNIDVPTARRSEAYDKLRQDWEPTKTRLTGRPWGTTNNTLYRENTRSLVLTNSNGNCIRSRSNGYATGNGMSPSQSGALPRKLSPIQRDNPSELDGQLTSDRYPEGQGSAHRNGIPLPKLDRPVYAEEMENGQLMVAAL